MEVRASVAPAANTFAIRDHLLRITLDEPEEKDEGMSESEPFL